MIRLGDYLAKDRVVDLKSTSKEAALLELVETFAGSDEVTDRDALLQAVIEREKIVSTGIGLGVAVPHAKIAGVAGFVVAYGRSAAGIPFGAIDDRPVHHIVLIAGPPDRQQLYLQFLATVTLTLKKPAFRTALTLADGPGEVHSLLCTV